MTEPFIMEDLEQMNYQTKEALAYLEDYTKSNNMEFFDLFDKAEIIDCISEEHWNKKAKFFVMGDCISKATALKATESWFNWLSKEELFFEEISMASQHELIVSKAKSKGHIALALVA